MGDLALWEKVLSGSIGAVAGSLLTLLSSRLVEMESRRRQFHSLQSCIAADIRAILRVIDTANVIEHCAVQYIHPDRVLTMASGPRHQDYFVLYNSIAREIGLLNRELATRASAFYLLLKGSRDTAESFKILREEKEKQPSNLADKEFKILLRETAKSVLEMLEDVFRNGLLAIMLAKRLEHQPQKLLLPERLMLMLRLTRDYDPPPPETEDSAKRYKDLFKTWLALVALRRILDGGDLHGNNTAESIRTDLQKALADEAAHVASIIEENNARFGFAALARKSNLSRKELIEQIKECCSEVETAWPDRLAQVMACRLQGPTQPLHRAQ